MIEDDYVLPCAIDGCKQPSQMPQSEYCFLHSAIGTTPKGGEFAPTPPLAPDDAALDAAEKALREFGTPFGISIAATMHNLRQRVRELEEFAERADASDAAWRILCGGKQKIIEQLEAERDALLDSVEYWWKMTEIERNDLRAWKAKVETLRPPHSIANAVATRVVLSVSEIPDRNSPDDFPEAMLVTADELRAIVMNALNATRDSESVS